MRSLIMVSAGVAAVMVANAAAAQVATSGTNQMAFKGTVQPGCITSIPASTSSQNATVTELVAGSANIVVTRLVGDDGVPLGAQIVLSLPAACNQAHTLNVSSLNGGLMNANGSTAGSAAFRALLPYTVQVNWAGQTQTLTSGAGAVAQPISDAATGPLSVTIQIPAGGSPMVAGSYSDQLVLELGVAG